jgi:hypothetical protein
MDEIDKLLANVAIKSLSVSWYYWIHFIINCV